MIRLSKAQSAIVKDLQNSPGSSFLFSDSEWALENAGRAFIVYNSHPTWSSFKVLLRLGIIEQNVIHPKFVRYSLTKGGERFVV